MGFKRDIANSEEELIKACQQNDRRAQGLLFKAYSRKFLGIAYRFAGDYDIANDLIQEGFIRIFTHISDYRFQGSFEGWMRRIVVTTAINYMKKHHKTDFEDIHDTDAAEVSVNPDPLSKMNCELIIEEIKRLPAGYRTILNLYAIEGYSYTEIAAMLQVKEVSVRTQYMRARQKLALALEKHYTTTDYAKKII